MSASPNGATVQLGVWRKRLSILLLALLLLQTRFSPISIPSYLRRH